MSLFIDGKQLLNINNFLNLGVATATVVKNVKAIDLNTHISTGFYWLGPGTVKNGPIGNGNMYGLVVVLDLNGNTALQFYTDLTQINTGRNPVYARMVYASDNVFPAWPKPASANDIENLQKQIDELKGK